MPDRTTKQKIENSPPSNSETGSEPTLKFFSVLSGYLSGYRREIIFSLTMAVLAGFCMAFQPLMVKFVIDNGILREGADMQERVRWVFFFGAIFLLISMGRVALFTLGYCQMVRYVEGIVFQIRTRFFLHVQHLCFRFHERTGAGEIFNYIMGSPVAQLKLFFNESGMKVPSLIVSWIVAVITLGTFDLLLTAVLLVTLVLVLLVNIRSRRRIREQTRTYLATESEASRKLADYLQGNRTVKISGLESYVQSQFSEQMAWVRQEGARLSARQHIEGIKPELLQYLSQGVVLVLGGYLCVSGSLSVGAFTAFVSSIALLTGPLIILAQMSLTLSNAQAGMHRIHSILQERTTTPEQAEFAELPVGEEGHDLIKFSGVHFAYQSLPVFADLNCTISKGERIALVGPSGSGKSTFVSLFLRLYEIDAGEIYFLGRSIKQLPLQKLRQLFGVVPQSPHLFQSSVRENLLVVRPDATEAELETVLRQAQAWDFVKALPNQLETRIGSDGFTISGGERQRLALARALLQQPMVLVLDEATSALDNRSEKLIKETLEKLPREMTIITIAHRLSTVRNADRILVFDHGKIVEEGTFDRLAEHGPLFRQLLPEEETGQSEEFLGSALPPDHATGEVK